MPKWAIIVVAVGLVTGITGISHIAYTASEQSHQSGPPALASTQSGKSLTKTNQSVASGTPGSATAPTASAGTNARATSSSPNPAAGTPSSTPGSGGTGTPSSPPPSGGNGSTPAVTLHYTANIGSAQSTAIALGFNVMDIAGSTSNPASTKSIIDGLPAGVQGLIWVGNLDNTNCTTPGFTDAQFQALVNGLAGDGKVFGYFLSDEPHPLSCTSAVSDIRGRADYLHAHAPGQKAFIVALDGSNQCGSNLGCEYNALQPANTHVDLIGLDPYPCHYSGTTAVPCDNTKITTAVNNAVANGISKSAIVPVFQTFGQEGRTDAGSVYYRTPSASELSGMLSTWAGLVPTPVMDYAYSFGVQCSTTCPAPQALINHSDLQTVINTHNR